MAKEADTPTQTIKEAEVTFGGQAFRLLPDRAVYWPEENLLFVADVHLGKAETFQGAGIPIPQAIHDYDLARLSNLLQQTGARRLMILGDLFHGVAGLTEDLLRRFSEWIVREGVAVTLVGGNHDRPVLSRLRSLPITVVAEPYVIRGVAFTHESVGDGPRWSGHKHPVLRLRGGPESLRLPCFWFHGDEAVLPAFGTFTGGQVIRRSKNDRVFVVADNEVVEV